MSRTDVIARIMQNSQRLRALGAGAIYLYGSYARDDASPASDVDIFIDRDPAAKFTYIELTEIEFLLQDALGIGVDVSTRSGLHPALSKKIEQSAVRIF